MKIVDFGLARNFHKTKITAGEGTAPYMPPEAFDEDLFEDPAVRERAPACVVQHCAALIVCLVNISAADTQLHT